MPSVEIQRHSCAHLLAAAVQELWPEAKFGVGPVVENGFYYDIELATPLTTQDLLKIEKRMGKIQERHEAFIREEMKIDEAIALFENLNQPFKVELLGDIKTRNEVTPEVVTIYRTGKFIDLCRGPHVENTREVGSYKLKSVAGAYWRGDEKNAQLQRVYGYCFATKPELDTFLTLMAEAEKRDHRKLGPELDLFIFSDLVGAGLPLFTPKGQLIRTLLDAFVWEMRSAKGYERVEIPHITKKDLYVKSGHWAKYQDDLFKVSSREGHEFAMKPMNCPHHTQIYARQQWSYREMPQRYANTTMCYRDEQTGELSGLSRARSFTQDDAHVFCRMAQVKDEMTAIWDIVHKFYATFGLKLNLRISTRDLAHQEKYLGTPENWDKAEGILHEIAADHNTEFVEGPGEAAFYGPKLDFMAKDSIGRTWQVATIQLDMSMPESFDLTCIGENGEKERIVMIHAAIMGSLERFMSILIEHVAGAFPVWLSPVQVAVVSVGKDHVEVAQELKARLAAAGVRAMCDDSNESVGYKIRRGAKQRIPYMLVIGDKEKDLQTLTVRIRGQEAEVPMAVAEFIDRVVTETKERKL
jgi:threonyl-tRNA synthetase